MAGLAGLAGLLGVELPQPVETVVFPPLLVFAFSSWLAERSDNGGFTVLRGTVFAFHPASLDELPHPVDTAEREGFDGLAGAAPQPVATGRREPAFPTVMGGSLSKQSTARSGTSCRDR